MLQGMEESVLGIHVAHGEGRLIFPDEEILESVRTQRLSTLAFVDDGGHPTTEYPFNPNGSPFGITGLTTPDGRHLAIMPHPERTFLKWQWHYMPAEMKAELEVSPWLRMFQNAYRWCQPNGN